MDKCPHCDGPLRAIHDGYTCDPCRWSWVVMEDVGPSTAPEEWVYPEPTPGAVRYGVGWVSPAFNGGRPR